MKSAEAAILAIGRHPEILETVLRLINQSENWSAEGAKEDDEAIRLFEQKRFDLVLLCAGITPESEAFLRAAFMQKDPEITIVQHYGGGSGLLSNEIIHALSQRRSL